MASSELPPSQQSEPLAGRWHGLGPVELRRLVLEGATIVLQDPEAQAERFNGETARVPVWSSRQAKVAKSAAPEMLLVCLTSDWLPAPQLAEQLVAAGFQHVFTADSHWGGLLAKSAAGADDRP